KSEAELTHAHRQLLESSRQAGMAEVATGVLHNVGNVLNSVNVSATLVIDQVRESKTSHVGKVAALLREHAASLATFIADDPKGSRIPGYLDALAEELANERRTIVGELEHLCKNIEHIKDIVAMQQNYAKVSGLVEDVPLVDVVEDALRMNAGAFARHGLEVIRDYQVTPIVGVERHKVLQVLVNLIRNAKYACDESGRPDKRIVISITQDGDRVRIGVVDNGIGIPPENLTRIFAHGFTTRKQGHGFGLHSGALAAQEMGGSLLAHSDGLGHGAAFTLELPLSRPAR
ncbi:MAG TPA: HAMP domain-containing sensor histidine kinase, partial [Opitutus sp.]|nr:HAMP domain-containing sensor histidine kinase [Opitutus sp.]